MNPKGKSTYATTRTTTAPHARHPRCSTANRLNAPEPGPRGVAGLPVNGKCVCARGKTRAAPRIARTRLRGPTTAVKRGEARGRGVTRPVSASRFPDANASCPGHSTTRLGCTPRASRDRDSGRGACATRRVVFFGRRTLCAGEHCPSTRAGPPRTGYVDANVYSWTTPRARERRVRGASETLRRHQRRAGCGERKRSGTRASSTPPDRVTGMYLLSRARALYVQHRRRPSTAVYRPVRGTIGRRDSDTRIGSGVIVIIGGGWRPVPRWARGRRCRTLTFELADWVLAIVRRAGKGTAAGGQVRGAKTERQRDVVAGSSMPWCGRGSVPVLDYDGCGAARYIQYHARGTSSVARRAHDLSGASPMGIRTAYT